jgi:hypothetical protein
VAPKKVLHRKVAWEKFYTYVLATFVYIELLSLLKKIPSIYSIHPNTEPLAVFGLYISYASIDHSNIEHSKFGRRE